MKHDVTQEQLDRFRHLIQFVIPNAPDDHGFDMTEWGKQTPDCGTHACALGWAAQDPSFQQAGLNHRWAKADFGKSGLLRFLDARGDEVPPLRIAQEFFGLTLWEADDLFMPNSTRHVVGPRAKRDFLERAREILAERSVA